MFTTPDFYKNALEQFPGICWIKDKNSVYRYVNPTTVMASGYQKDEMIGNNDFNFSWNDSAELFIEQDKNTLKGNTPFLIDTPMSRDGSRLIILSQKKPLYEGNIKLLGVICTGLYFDKENYKNIFRALWHGFKLTDFITPMQKKMKLVYGNLEFNIKQARIVGYLLRGCSAKQIASKIFLSSRTVEKIITSIHQEIGCRNKNEFIEKAFALGFIELMFMQ